MIISSDLGAPRHLLIENGGDGRLVLSQLSRKISLDGATHVPP